MDSRFKVGLLLVLLAGAQAWGWIEVSRAVRRGGPASSHAARGPRDSHERQAGLERSSGARAAMPEFAEPASQAERMLRDPLARDPAFIPPAPRKPRVAWGAGCRTRDGAIRLSWADPEGYARCLEERSAPGAGARAAGAIIAP